ncbi:dynein heavy chain 12, axonemal-like [Mauremys reevesii]|uniref:dynein heavy chain 12, axonemal-like n=1 Tax=Mauremys reevesii TaxID=260615 RepID=UPI00193F4FE2|nr:dynein heavy chain 12, axonemal-like [Mauremys reevesii]
MDDLVKCKIFVPQDSEICLDACSVFIAINHDYVGRNELPDNLKVLFQKVAMMVPEYTLIAEISFYSLGFVDTHSFAAKNKPTHRLCSDQMSSQENYD